MDEQGHNPEREATQEQIAEDRRLRRGSEPAEGGYGAELEDPDGTSGESDATDPESETPPD